jgi:hypothetical protein
MTKFHDRAVEERQNFSQTDDSVGNEAKREHDEENDNQSVGREVEESNYNGRRVFNGSKVCVEESGKNLDWDNLASKTIPPANVGNFQRKRHLSDRDSVELSEYEKIRAIKIERNNERLRSLGLLKDSNSVVMKEIVDVDAKKKPADVVVPKIIYGTRSSTRNRKVDLDEKENSDEIWV